MNYKIKKYLKKFKKLYSIISSLYYYIIGIYFSFFMIIFSMFRINKKKIMILSYYGKDYGDNGKYIVEELLKNKNNKIKIYWAVKNIKNNNLPKEVLAVKFNSIRYLYHLATSKVWINNTRFLNGIRKRKKQFYIQTWHSSLRLKTIENDAVETLNPKYIKRCIADSKMIDIIVSGCEFSSEIYRKSFWYKGEVLNCGTPRCDLFFNKKETLKLKYNICKEYKIEKSKKIILYAPTFRKNTDENLVYLNLEKTLTKFGNDYVFLVRIHPISKYKIKNKKVINVTDYPDMQELIAISDFLITDYSGCCFDAMIKKTPCILFTKDLNEYLKKERNLYFNFEELPFPSVNSELGLYKCIINFDYNDYCKKIEKFNKKIKLYERGNASKIISEKIIERCFNEKI